MLFAGALEFAAIWALMDRRLMPICDRVLWRRIVQSGVQRAASELHTLCFRENYAGNYRMFGLAPPAGAREGDDRTHAAVQLARRMGYPEIAWSYQKIARYSFD